MFEFGKKLAKKANVILLEGDLWAGKTLLAKWFAKWLWIDENIVQSPTYAYINIYDDKVLHIDMYRIESYEDLIEKWIINEINQYKYIVIEWPKFVDNLWINKYLEINISKKSESKRNLKIREIWY